MEWDRGGECAAPLWVRGAHACQSVRCVCVCSAVVCPLWLWLLLAAAGCSPLLLLSGCFFLSSSPLSGRAPWLTLPGALVATLAVSLVALSCRRCHRGARRVSESAVGAAAALTAARLVSRRSRVRGRRGGRRPCQFTADAAPFISAVRERPTAPASGTGPTRTEGKRNADPNRKHAHAGSASASTTHTIKQGEEEEKEARHAHIT